MRRWHCQDDSVKLSFEISEIARYTTTLKLTVQTPKIEIARSGQLILRLYHDAQMAEVMEGSGPSALRAIYEQAADGKTVDEKRQANLFIGECLRACFRQAQSQATNSPI